MLPAWPWWPAVETITMMLPSVPRSTITRATCLVHRKVPVRLTASWRFRSMHWRPLARLVSIVLAGHGCAGQPAAPPPALAALVRAWDADLAPYNPFTASELGQRQYDGTLANDIGDEYRAGMKALCT